MTDPWARLLAAALALAPAACSGHRGESAGSSVTVRLPPARPAPARPAFSFHSARTGKPRPPL
jgi:hypothetical protein